VHVENYLPSTDVFDNISLETTKTKSVEKLFFKTKLCNSIIYVNRKMVLCAAYLHFNSIDNCLIGNALENPVVFVILNLTSIEGEWWNDY
jgi:hypothetical protein